MARRITSYRSLLPARCRLLHLIALATAVAAGGCASAPTPGRLTQLHLSEAPRWISATDVTRFGCPRGVMDCLSDGGRLSERRCRCPDAR